MDEFNKFFDEKFFIIDFNNLDSIKSKVIGFGIFNGRIITNKEWDRKTVFNGNGTYVQIIRTPNNISIYQDFNGSFGIYLFRNGKYFAISNSFMKLLDYIKENYSISLNEDYANHFISIDLCSLSYRETLINEIEVLPKNYVINIDLNSHELTFEKIDYEEFSIPISSKEGINILDNWFNNWINIFRYLKHTTNNISLQLSGGFDSRLSLALILSANINLNHILIYSIDDDEHTHSEDFEIASQIADYFGFKLNRNTISSKRIYFEDIETPIYISFFTKLGFHKQMFYTYSYKLDPVYSITGYGGECIREYWNYPPENLINIKNKRTKRFSPKLVNSMKNILQNSFIELEKEYGGNDLSKLLYDNVRSKNHFGKLSSEFYLTNLFKLSPLLDPMLHKLRLNDDACNDKNLLIAVIFSRYCPELLNFDFNNNRDIDENTIRYAFEINKKYPFKKYDYKIVSGPEINVPSVKFNNSFKKGDAEDYVEKIFRSAPFKKLFELNFSFELYEVIVKKLESSNYFSLENAYACIAVIKALNDVNYSSYKNSTSLKDKLTPAIINYDKFESDYPLNTLKKYTVARIDIRIFGAESNIEIMEISKEPTVIYPNWFENNKGGGVHIESQKNSLDIKIKCIGEGVLKIYLRGIFKRRDKNNNLPIFINFNKLIVNDEIIFDEDKIVCHDEPFIYSTNVKNEDIFKLHFDWKPV